MGNSNGSAVGQSLSSALKRGILELIERDKFISFWVYGKGSIQEIECSNNVFDKHLVRGYTTRMFLIDGFPKKIKLVWTILVRRKGMENIFPYASFNGFSASFNLNSAILNSFQEALMIFNDKFDDDFKETTKKIGKASTKKKSDFSLDEQIYFWGSTKSIKELDKMLQIYADKTIFVDINNLIGGDVNKIQFSFSYIQRKYKEIWFVNLEDPILNQMELFSVKCFSPNLMNMYFFQDFYNLAKKNGLFRPLAIPIA